MKEYFLMPEMLWRGVAKDAELNTLCLQRKILLKQIHVPWQHHKEQQKFALKKYPFIM